MTNVFIAPKIKVGFQKRTDTFTGQLAYIIYYDNKGKLRKETSWEGWRDKTIDPQEFDNAPMDGFTLNKDVKRYSGDWFSSHRTMIRIHDPRGFEFEVTTENLIGILMHTDCLRRGLIGQFVYAWVGPELVLLPTNSEEYQNAVKYTTNLSKKVKQKEMVPGISYKTKREGDIIFMGKLNWYEYEGKSRYHRTKGVRKEGKVLVFTNDEGKTFVKKPSVEFLSHANSDTPVSNFAELMDKFNAKSYANKIVKYEFRPATFDTALKGATYYGSQLNRNVYFTGTSTLDMFKETSVTITHKHEYDEHRNIKYVFNGYDVSNENGGYTGIKQADGELVEVPSDRNRNYNGWSGYNNKAGYSLEYMQGLKLYDLYVTYENGKEKLIKSVYELTGETY
jgi:hypothetical protein